MRFTIFAIVVLLIAQLIFNKTYAQPGEVLFSNRSSSEYLTKIQTLEQYKVSKAYDEKSAQAWYDEILTNRKDELIEIFKDDHVLHDTLLLNLCNRIFDRIKKGNPNYNFDDIQIYIHRSPILNAANYGEGTVVMNLGLFLWMDNEDEIALILGHEIAHQLLAHFDSKVKQSISTITSDDFQKELRSIKRSEYNKVTRFRELMKGLSMEKGKHSRYKETEADSLGYVFTKNAGYDMQKASLVLLKLDKAEDIFVKNNLYSLKSFFDGIDIQQNYFNPKRKYNGLSKVNVTMNVNADLDSIKTHPDCKERYKKISNANEVSEVDCCLKITSNLKQYKERALIEIVRRLYEEDRLSLAIHYCFMGLNNQFNKEVFQRFISLCFSKLYYNDENLKRFNSVNTGARNESTLKELQDYLFEVSKKDLGLIAQHYLNLNNQNSVDDAFVQLQYNILINKENPTSAIESFNDNFPNNKYQYLITKQSK